MFALRRKNRTIDRRKSRRKSTTRVALLESLEVREVPAIALFGTELRITGSELNDQVMITSIGGSTGLLTVSHTKTSAGGQTTESKSFAVVRVANIRADLGNGDNQLTNNTSFPIRVFGGSGADVLTGGSGNDELYGAGGSDILKGRDGNDRLEGGIGIDVIEGGTGNDQILGGDGNDNLKGDAGNDSIQGGAGDDVIQGGAGLDQIRGNDGNDQILGGNENDSIWGDAGNDILQGELGDDKVYGGTGGDKLVGGDGNDLLFGDADADELVGGNGNDRAYGGDGVDTLFGNAGNDFLYGDAGNDVIEGGSGTDAIFGGDGNDKLHGHSAAANDSTFDGPSTIRGGNGDDLIRSASGNDLLHGEAGEDNIQAGAGNDRVYGGTEDDYIHGGLGDDELYGDGGNDSVNGGLGNDRIEGGAGNDMLAANVITSKIDDGVINGDESDTAGNTIEGGQGNDRLLGSNKNDILIGNDGDDWLSGLAGLDELYGGNGKDVLLGGSGADKMDGGLGADRIVSIDGVVDVIIPQPPTASTVERDELWIDTLDRLGNLAAVVKVQATHPNSVNVVNQYRAYDAFGSLQYRPPLTWGLGDLIDPDARAQHQNQSQFLTRTDYGTSPLFGPNGPVWNDVDQGDVGTCYFLSRLAALAKTHPQHIRDMVTELGDGTFVVKFLNQEGQKVYVRVDGDLYRDGNILYADRGTGNSMWVAVVEKAWAIHRFGYATYDSINGGNGPQNDDRTDTAMALGIEDLKFNQTTFPTPQMFANSLKAMLDSGRGVVFGGRSFINDTMPLIPENYRRSEHILMLHSVETNSAGNVTKIRYYDLYGGPLKEMTNLNTFFYGCGGITAFKPLA